MYLRKPPWSSFAGLLHSERLYHYRRIYQYYSCSVSSLVILSLGLLLSGKLYSKWRIWPENSALLPSSRLKAWVSIVDSRGSSSPPHIRLFVLVSLLLLPCSDRSLVICNLSRIRVDGAVSPRADRIHLWCVPTGARFRTVLWVAHPCRRRNFPGLRASGGLC